MEKSPDAFRTISEAAEELDLPQHVLRFWETRFSTIKPLKRGGGRRYYRPEDVLLLKGIRHLLYDRGYTIKGVQRIIKDNGSRYVAAIGQGIPMEEIGPVPPDDDGAQPEIELDESEDEPVLVKAPSDRVLDAKDRDRLNEVLRQLLECKRMLERARET